MKIVKTIEYITRISDSKLEINKEILDKLFKKTDVIYKSEGTIIKDSDGYFITNDSGSNEYWWRMFFIMNRSDFMTKVLGYDDNGTGTFPYCKNKEDIIKLMNAIIEKIIK